MKALHRLLSFVHRKSEPEDSANWLLQMNANRLTDEAFAARCREMRVLIAEDGDFLREGIEQFLRRHFASVEAVENGRMALDRYRAASGAIDVIFLDVQMPIMGGIEAARHIRQSGLPGADTIPIIAMTGDAAPEILTVPEFQTFLKKPFSFDALLRIVRDTLEEATPQGADMP